jgi:hypothetical protein
MPTVKIKGKTVHLPYTKAGKKLAVKLRKKKKKLPYGQIPTGSGPENPIGGN